MFEKKVWGEVWHIFHSQKAAVSHLQLKAGFRCSKHSHLERANQFAVISGVVAIQVWDHDGVMHETVLRPGQSKIVPSSVLHRFRVLESGSMVEVYWPDILNGKVSLTDIDRVDEGGVDDNS
jgi:mannose-6-phosphate isomerase-like protein (cupin superfamily)